MLCPETLRWLSLSAGTCLSSSTHTCLLKNDLNYEDFDLKTKEFYIVKSWWILRQYFRTCWGVKASELVREELWGKKCFVSWTETTLKPPVCHRYTLVFQHHFVLVPERRLSRVFYVLSRNAFAAIFTSCFEISCVSCPLTKQKLADLMCITQRKKKKRIRQRFRYAKQVEVQRMNLAAWLLSSWVIKASAIKSFLSWPVCSDVRWANWT